MEAAKQLQLQVKEKVVKAPHGRAGGKHDKAAPKVRPAHFDPPPPHTCRSAGGTDCEDRVLDGPASGEKGSKGKISTRHPELMPQTDMPWPGSPVAIWTPVARDRSKRVANRAAPRAVC